MVSMAMISRSVRQGRVGRDDLVVAAQFLASGNLPAGWKDWHPGHQASGWMRSRCSLLIWLYSARCNAISVLAASSLVGMVVDLP
jgi:hypothetical protein